MNLIPGIKTVESCCGHGEWPFKIWFIADTLESLPPLLYWFDPCHCGLREWAATVYTDCAMSPVVFRITGPVGTEAYDGAEKIAHLINDASIVGV